MLESNNLQSFLFDNIPQFTGVVTSFQGMTFNLIKCPIRHNHGMSQQVQTRSEEHTSELQSLMRISYAVFCLKKKKKPKTIKKTNSKQSSDDHKHDTTHAHEHKA